eukprot:CAMPEP_0202477508 /NCGR_PEP_ID=MMETSP1360-20130828/93980_1 /ASSEMBLY_ACC=CAM_ASM_000848 /TAXON_ID=515479 /ORGANISM="Licmophora paradoxa, Strain CCMP2313" /LENGTH=101 /DNA_ID=CAMNT_0049104755 /DNA_START=370 /DNA_END=675 /DNA_ORIENTATION=+
MTALTTPLIVFLMVLLSTVGASVVGTIGALVTVTSCGAAVVGSGVGAGVTSTVVDAAVGDAVVEEVGDVFEVDSPHSHADSAWEERKPQKVGSTNPSNALS